MMIPKIVTKHFLQDIVLNFGIMFFQRPIYTHRQKLSNSKLVLNIKKMFRTKILEIQVLLSSFDFIVIEYQCN